MTLHEAMKYLQKGWWTRLDKKSEWITLKDGNFVNCYGQPVKLMGRDFNKKTWMIRAFGRGDVLLNRVAERIYKHNLKKKNSSLCGMSFDEVLHQVKIMAKPFRGWDGVLLAKTFIKEPWRAVGNEQR